MDNMCQTGRPVFLIVDDDDIMRALLRSWMIINFPFSHIVEAKNGREALYMAQSRTPDVILMDIWMPVMDGFEATLRIKICEPDIKIMVITSDENGQCRDRALSAGADGYFLKREMATDLIPALREILYFEAGTGTA